MAFPPRRALDRAADASEAQPSGPAREKLTLSWTAAGNCAMGSRCSPRVPALLLFWWALGRLFDHLQPIRRSAKLFRSCFGDNRKGIERRAARSCLVSISVPLFVSRFLPHLRTAGSTLLLALRKGSSRGVGTILCVLTDVSKGGKASCLSCFVSVAFLGLKVGRVIRSARECGRGCVGFGIL